MEIEAVFNLVESQPPGLTQDEAQRRLATYGPDRLRPPKRRSPWILFLTQFKNLLIYVLVGAALVTTLLGHWADAAFSC